MPALRPARMTSSLLFPYICLESPCPEAWLEALGRVWNNCGTRTCAIFLWTMYSTRAGANSVAAGRSSSSPPQVFDLLVYVIRNRERVVSKDDLISAIWVGRIVSDSALITRINAARTAVGDSGEQQRLIKTLPRKGIRHVARPSRPRRRLTAACAYPATAWNLNLCSALFEETEMYDEHLSGRPNRRTQQ